MVEDSEAEDDVELAMNVAAQGAHVAGDELDLTQPLFVAGLDSLREVLRAPLDPDDLTRSEPGRFERVDAIGAAEVEHTRPAEIA